MRGKTTTNNHLIQLWVAFTWHKPFMILLNGQIPVGTHQNGHAMGGYAGLGLLCLKCLWPWLKKNYFTFQTIWVVFPNGHSRHCAQG
jgi:hypothetical protein